METKTTQKDTTLEAASFYPDLLCVVGGRKTRMPFETGKDLNPIGFFPFDDDVYMEFDHSPIVPRRKIKIERKEVLPLVFFERLFLRKNEINAFLAQMGKPLLEKKFFASGGCGDYNWIVDFSTFPNCLDRDFFDDTHKAVYIPWGKV